MPVSSERARPWVFVTQHSDGMDDMEMSRGGGYRVSMGATRGVALDDKDKAKVR